MRKRASVALLRLKDPELILLDEPFSALDPTGIDEISRLLMQLPATQIWFLIKWKERHNSAIVVFCLRVD